MIKGDRLSEDIKKGRTGNLYFIYGKEPVLITMYADRLVEKAVGADADDLNLQRLNELPDPELLSDYVEALPVFADKKAVMVKDFDPEKPDAELSKQYLRIVSDVPETTVLIFYSPSLDISEKGMKSKTKKFIEAVDKHGIVCSVDQMDPEKIAELCVRKAAQTGIVISPEDAMFLTERTGGQMIPARDEMSKLINYVGKGGRITRGEIEMLVAKQLSASVFDLADSINAMKREEAFRIIDELFLQQIDAINIMGALSKTFLDMYCAKLAKADGISPQKAAPMFGCNVWAFSKKIYPAAERLPVSYLRRTVSALSEADITLKSRPIDQQTVIEETVVKLFELRKSLRS